MSGSFNGPAGFKSATWAGKGSEVDEKTGERIDGICKFCHQWDAELKDGYCRDQECRDKRVSDMVKRGEAVRFHTDVVDENGKAGTRIEKGDQVHFFERTDSDE